MEEDNEDIYFDEGTEDAITDDEISPEEEAFMSGYNDDYDLDEED